MLHAMLYVARCMLHAAGCMLPHVACCMQHATCYMLACFAACCMLYVVTCCTSRIAPLCERDGSELTAPLMKAQHGRYAVGHSVTRKSMEQYGLYRTIGCMPTYSCHSSMRLARGDEDVRARGAAQCNVEKCHLPRIHARSVRRPECTARRS